MINGERIGVGIITGGDRPELLKKLIESLKGIDIDEISIQNQSTKQTVGKNKNDALKTLSHLEHIFLIEDDIYIKDSRVFEKYIEASKETGIQHFNFSQHGMMNKSWPGGTPNPRITIDYGSVNIPMYPHCVGAFSYYSDRCLEKVGYICDEYVNACEHVDHTYQIVKAGMHPPFWYFADIENSWEYLGDDEWSREKSTISSAPNHNQMMVEADKIFVKRNGLLPGQIPDVSGQIFSTTIKEIKKKYGN